MAWKRAINIHTGKPKWGPGDFPSSRLSAQLPPLTMPKPTTHAHPPRMIIWAPIKGLFWACCDWEWGGGGGVRWSGWKRMWWGVIYASWHQTEEEKLAQPTICFQFSSIKASILIRPHANNLYSLPKTQLTQACVCCLQWLLDNPFSGTPEETLEYCNCNISFRTHRTRTCLFCVFVHHTMWTHRCVLFSQMCWTSSLRLAVPCCQRW